MKKVLLSAAIAAALAASAAAVAQDKPQSPRDNPSPSTSQQAATSRHGTILSVDETGKSFVMKEDVSGKEVTVYWDSSTKVNGDLKAGSAVAIQSTEQDGRTVATSIDARAGKKPY